MMRQQLLITHLLKLLSNTYHPFAEFAYVMTGPHLDDEGKDGTGIPLTKGQSLPNIEKLGLVRRILASPVSKVPSAKNLTNLSDLVSVMEKPASPKSKHQLKADVVVERVCDIYEKKTTDVSSESSSSQSYKSAKSYDLSSSISFKSARGSDLSMASCVINQMKK